MKRLLIKDRLHLNSYFNLLIILLLFSSCQTYSYYNYESMTAPKVIIPPDVKTIAFVDRNLTFDLDTNVRYYKFDDLLLKDTVNYSNVMAESCFKGVSENMSDYFALDTMPFYQLGEQKINGGRKYTPLEWGQVDSLCQLNNSDILICLEDLQVFNTYETIKNVEDVGNIGITDIKYFAVWRIYDPLTQKYTDERIVNDSLYSEVSSYSFQELIEEELPKRREVMNDVSYEVGRNYSELLSPKWENIHRKYFIAGDQRFAVAEYYFENDQIEKAIELWKELSESEKPKIAGRACYNMAFAHELKEDFNEANHWIRKSVSKYKQLKSLPAEYKLIEMYALLLIERTQNYYHLNKFFGKE